MEINLETSEADLRCSKEHVNFLKKLLILGDRSKLLSHKNISLSKLKSFSTPEFTHSENNWTKDPRKNGLKDWSNERSISEKHITESGEKTKGDINEQSSTRLIIGTMVASLANFIIFSAITPSRS
jgi:hypothetical protein